MRSGAGLTLVEVLVAMLLVLLVGAASLAFVARGRAAARAGASQAELEETLDAAFAILGTEIAMAGYAGLAPPGAPVVGASTIGSPEPAELAVSGSCGSSLAHDFDHPLAAADGAYLAAPGRPLGCPAIPSGRTAPGSDTLTVRRAAAKSSDPAAGRLQLATRLRQARLAADGASGAQSPARWHDLEVGVYYVSADSTALPGRPSLRRKRLVGGVRPAFQDEELVSGVADLQLHLGLDADGDGAIDHWSRPGTEAAGEILRAVRVEIIAQSELRDPGLSAALRRRQAARIFALRNAVMQP